MKKPSRSRKSSNSVFQNPAVIGAIITGVVAIVTTWLTVLPNLRSQRAQGEEPTRTATIEAQPSSAAGVPAIEPTLTATPTLILSTDTPTPTPTLAPVSLNCLERWIIVDTAQLLTEQEGREGCTASNYRGLGFSTSAEGFLVTLNKFRTLGVFGISTPLPENAAVIRLNVKVRTLYTAEFWIGVANSRNPQERDVMILAIDPEQVQPGGMRIYFNDLESKVFAYPWSDLDPTGGLSNKPPYDYKIQFTVNGGNVSTKVNNKLLDPQVVNFPKYLFIGFRNKSTVNSVTMNVTAADLKFEIRK